MTSLKKAKTIDLAVGFLMESGVKLLIDHLKLVAQSGVRIKSLTGNYLNITQPQALYLVKETLGDKVDLRFYNIKNKSFHPKSYIFEYEDYGDVFIGSSNMSRSALTSGIEWNYWKQSLLTMAVAIKLGVFKSTSYCDKMWRGPY